MSQPNANTWMSVLLVVLEEAIRELGDAPARHLQELLACIDAVQPPGDADTLLCWLPCSSGRPERFMGNIQKGGWRR